jgi:NACalpha-BTF3-like transcription factor
MQLVDTGPLIYALMQLNRIPAEDIELVMSYLNPSDEEAETIDL